MYLTIDNDHTCEACTLNQCDGELPDGIRWSDEPAVCLICGCHSGVTAQMAADVALTGTIDAARCARLGVTIADGETIGVRELFARVGATRSGRDTWTFADGDMITLWSDGSWSLIQH